MRVLLVNFNDELSQSKDFFRRLKNQQTATNLACIASNLIQDHHLVKFSDYDIERLSNETILTDCNDFKPHLIVAYIDGACLSAHLQLLKKVKEQFNGCKIVLSSDYLFYMDCNNYAEFDLDIVDVIIREEPDGTISKLLDALYDTYPITRVLNVKYKKKHEKAPPEWHETDFDYFDQLDISSVAYRKLMKNEMYKDLTGTKPMAIIKATRGSSSMAIHKATQRIEGSKIRTRTPASIAKEVEICYKDFGITEFYFECDDFLFNEQWAYDVAYEIRNTDVLGKIHFMTRIHLNNLDSEVIEQMQFAGFNLAILDLCSGASDTLRRAKLGISNTASYEQSMKILHHYGIRTYGIYRIGFPWETKKHIADTIKLISTLNHSHLDFQILTLPYNCEAIETFKEDNLLGEEYDLVWTITGTRYLKRKELDSQYKNFILKHSILSKIKKEKVTYNLYVLSDNDKKVIKRKSGKK